MTALNSRPKQLPAFLHNSKAAILATVAAFLFCLQSFGQVDTTKAFSSINQPRLQYKEIRIDSSLRIPRDTFKLRQSDTGAIAFKAGFLWVWKYEPPLKWSKIEGSGGLDSVKVRNDSLFAYKSGAETFVVKILVAGNTVTNAAVSGYSWVKPPVGNDVQVKKVVAGYLILPDSSVANLIRFNYDTANAPRTVFKDSTGIIFRYGTPSAPNLPDTIEITSTATGGADIGVIEFVATDNSATYQNDSLIGRDIIGIWIENNVVGSDPRSTSIYYSFNSLTGTITFNNGYIAEDDLVYIQFGTKNLIAGIGVLSTFSPSSIAWKWYDLTVDSGHVDTAGRIKRLVDLVGTHDLVQPTYSDMPSFVSSGGGQAHFPTDRFTSLPLDLGADSVTGNFTIYAVIQKRAAYAFVNSGEIFTTNTINTSNGIGEQTSTWGDGLLVGRDGITTSSAVMFKSDDYVLLRVKILQGNVVNIHINGEPIMREGYAGPTAGTMPKIKMLHLGQRSALPAEFQCKEIIICTTNVSNQTDIDVWNYARVKHSLVAKPYLLMIGDSHTYGSQTGTVIGNPAWLLLTDSLGFRVYNNGITGSKAYDPAAPSTPTNLNNIVTTWLAQGTPSVGYIAVSYGTNDLEADIALSSWKTNFKAAIQAMINAGYDPQRIILWTPPYTTNPAYDDNVNDAAVIIEDIASELGTRFADVRQAMIDAGLDCFTVTGGDGIHGNDAIHSVIAITIKAQVI